MNDDDLFILGVDGEPQSVRPPEQIEYEEEQLKKKISQFGEFRRKFKAASKNLLGVQNEEESGDNNSEVTDSSPAEPTTENTNMETQEVKAAHEFVETLTGIKSVANQQRQTEGRRLMLIGGGGLLGAGIGVGVNTFIGDANLVDTAISAGIGGGTGMLLGTVAEGTLRYMEGSDKKPSK